MQRLKALFDLLKQSFTEWREDLAPMLAAALAYYSAFSIAPLLVIVIALVGLFAGEQTVQTEIVEQLRGTIGPDAADAVAGMIESTSEQRSQGIISTILSVAGLLFGAIGLFTHLQKSLDLIWNVEDDSKGGGIMAMVKDKLLSFGMIIVIGFLLLVSLILSAALSGFDSYLQGLFPGAQIVLQILSIVVSFGVITLLFMMIYKYLPHAEIAWSDVWVGAAVTALLFTIGKFLLGLYLGNSSTTSTYGAAGAFVLLLLWVYYSAQILLFGAEFTQVYARRYGSRIVAADYESAGVNG